MNPTLIVLTGAASGIGKQLLATFLDRQVPLILVDLDAGKLENLAQDSKSVDWVDGDVAQQCRGDPSWIFGRFWVGGH
jgi:NADP-dependent 3-hydroxy acid dehydrogenase YdfG